MAKKTMYVMFKNRDVDEFEVPFDYEVPCPDGEEWFRVPLAGDAAVAVSVRLAEVLWISVAVDVDATD